jgi:hypothetical protein
MKMPLRKYFSKIINKYKNRYFDGDLSKPFDIEKFVEGEIFRYVFEYFYCFVKQYGNYCEHEYRFLIKTDRKPKFSVKKGMFIPYIAVMNKNKKQIPINKIIIGPNNNNEEQVEKGLRLFLDANGYKHVGITRSRLKIRPQ